VVGAAIAFIGFRIGLVPIVGFLVAGVVIRPNGLGLVRDAALVDAAAEVGVILLLFTIGIEFSMEKLGRIRRLIPFKYNQRSRSSLLGPRCSILRLRLLQVLDSLRLRQPHHLKRTISRQESVLIVVNRFTRSRQQPRRDVVVFHDQHRVGLVAL